MRGIAAIAGKDGAVVIEMVRQAQGAEEHQRRLRRYCRQLRRHGWGRHRRPGQGDPLGGRERGQHRRHDPHHRGPHHRQAGGEGGLPRRCRAEWTTNPSRSRSGREQRGRPRGRPLHASVLLEQCINLPRMARNSMLSSRMQMRSGFPACRAGSRSMHILPAPGHETERRERLDLG